MHEHGTNCDIFYISSKAVPFTNLNLLHYAVVIGDVALMEEVVALGALDENAEGLPPVSAPPGSTALLLACALLAVVGEKERNDRHFRRAAPVGALNTIGGICECAIRLVHLGADCQVKLQIPAQRRSASVNPIDPVTAFRKLNLVREAARKVASISCRQELIRAIELMQKLENIHLTQCRCGSRLPWNQCHGVSVPGQSDLYIQADDGRLNWRYSPKARRPCKLTNKEHYECCRFTYTPSYKNDASGRLFRVFKKPLGGPTTPALIWLQQMMSEIMNPNDLLLRKVRPRKKSEQDKHT